MHLFCIEIMWIALWLTISIVILLDGYNYLILNKYSIIVYIKSIHPYIAPLNIVNAFSVHYIVIFTGIWTLYWARNRVSVLFIILQTIDEYGYVVK